MILEANDRRLAYTDFKSFDLGPDATLSVGLSMSGSTWVPMTIIIPGERGAVLVAGPGATSNPAGTIVLPASPPDGTTHLFVKVVDGNETFYLRWGPFTLR